MWSLYWVASNIGVLDPPVVGSFENNVGHFFTKDTFNGKNIIVVFRWDVRDKDHPVWSQAFSPDNGKTWEWNWYNVSERINNKSPDISTAKDARIQDHIKRPYRNTFQILPGRGTCDLQSLPGNYSLHPGILSCPCLGPGDLDRRCANLDILQENASVFAEPGEVVVGPSRPTRVKTSNCFGIYYGQGKGLDAANMFPRVVDADVKKLEELGDRIWKNGPQELRIVALRE